MSRTISTKSDTLRLVPQRFDGEARGFSSGLVGGLTAVSRVMTAPLRRAWVRHRDQQRLQELSDYQLRDIGIRRGQIHEVVRDGHY